MSDASTNTLLEALATCLDDPAGRYQELRGVRTYGEYVVGKGAHADEELLVEPVLQQFVEKVLDFPVDAYFPQMGKGGVKPDLTPIDLIAHSFVLDAKSSDEDLSRHERQIRRYITQRSLEYGILFNLRELRVYRRNEKGYDPELSFLLLPLWQLARGEAFAVPELEPFERFCARFAYREMGLADKVDWVRRQKPWSLQLDVDPHIEVDVEFLVRRLHDLSRDLADDAAVHADQLDRFLTFMPARDEKVLGELRQIALDVAPGTDLESLPATLGDWRGAADLPGRVWRQYLLRVAYLALARILLYRAWEDVEFVDQLLYDGGFDKAYDRLSESARDVLDEAFHHGADRYRWLFGADNNYEWYRPSEAVLVDVLYSLAPVPLGKLDADVLGALYVSYVDEIDRDRLGQFFTPRPVVRFMLDRAGFKGANGVFHIEGNERKPVRLLDFATGSGGFLVEAARRIIDEGGVDAADAHGLEEALAAIVRGFTGGEISPFPYYLTEINLLLQVSRLLGPLGRAGGDKPPPFVLGALHVDTLTAKSSPAASLDVGAKLRGDHAELVGDETYDLVPLDGEKLDRYRQLREDGSFDLVVGNPPYVTEANNKPLFQRLRAIPAWKGIYRGKTDYLYYFLWLAVEKLAPGGRLCVITPAGWMNAGAADFLREKLTSELRLDELYLFGSYRLFADEQGPAPTPTVESAILVAAKAAAPEDHALRVVALEDEAAAPAGRQDLLDEMQRRARGDVGRSGGIHVHDVSQTELHPERPWPVKHTAGDLAARVVRHLEVLLGAGRAQPLREAWKVFLGIQTGADAFSKKIAARLSPEATKKLGAEGVRQGEPIYALPPGTELSAPWRDHPESLVRSPEPEGVLYGAVDPEEYVSLVWLTSQNPPVAVVLREIERWRPLLEARAEFVRNPRRSWWETCWPRDPHDLHAPKVIALHRTDRGRFALDETGDWSPSGRMSVVVGRSPDAPVAYLCGVLNSELLDLWYSVRGRVPRDIWRDYEPKPMSAMPYRRPEGDPRAERVAELVRTIADNRRALLPHRAVVRDLGRIVKDPWKTGPVEVDRRALLAELPSADTVSVRLDPGLEATVAAGPVGKPRREGPGVLNFRRGKVETARVTGDEARLDLLEELLGGKAPDDLLSIVLPRDLDAFAQRARERVKIVTDLLTEGRRLVEEIERLVCALYGLPDELTDEVVAHAVGRAGSAPADEEE